MRRDDERRVISKESCISSMMARELGVREEMRMFATQHWTPRDESIGASSKLARRDTWLIGDSRVGMGCRWGI